MTDKKIRFAFIGCGAISAKHAEALAEIEDAELAAVCDQAATAAKSAGEKYGVPCYTNPHEMAEREHFDVFSVLTPSGDHAAQILDLARHRRHFVVEKPLALRVEDADAAIEACDAAGVKLFVVKQNRFNRPVRALKNAIDAGRLGKQVIGTVRVRWRRDQSYYDAKPWRGTWAADGGVLTNQASHHIDLLVWLMGDVDSVMAMTTTRLVDIEAEDTGVAILRFHSGALGIIEATTAARPNDLEGSLSLLGEGGSVEIGGFATNELKTWKFVEPQPEDATAMEAYGGNPDGRAWNHAEYLKDVVRALKGGGRGLVDGLEGRRSLELINAIYESAETGRQVALRFRPLHSRLGIPKP